MLNICKIRDSKETYQCFDRTVHVLSHHQQEEDKGDEKTVYSDADVSVSSTKTNGWRRLKISLHRRKQVKKYRSDLIEIIMMVSGTTINLFGNPNMITNRKKSEIPMNFLTNAGSKIVDEVGELLEKYNNNSV